MELIIIVQLTIIILILIKLDSEIVDTKNK
jgi:hypothetical protein